MTYYNHLKWSQFKANNNVKDCLINLLQIPNKSVSTCSGEN